MKVHLPKKKLGNFRGFTRFNTPFFVLVCLMIGIKPNLFAEGSKDFVNYPGLRMFLDTRDPQQLKVYAAEGETINVGSSHVGIQGGFIRVYDPTGATVTTFNNTGATTGLGIINNNVEEISGPTGGGSTNGSGYEPGVITVPPGGGGIWTIEFDYPFYTNAQFQNIANNAPWTRANNQPNTTRVVLAWDITVTQGGAGNQGGVPIEGRVYSNEHISVLQGNTQSPLNPINTSPIFYVLTEDGYLYQVNINEADPYRFPISSNSFGLVDGNANPIYKSKTKSDFVRSADPSSWDPNGIYLYEPQAQGFGSFTNNKIFFNIPDTNMPSTAMVTDIFRGNTHEIWLMEDLEILTIDSLYLIGQSDSGSDCSPGTIEFQKGGYFVFETNLGGVVTLLLDLNNNGVYTDSVDVTVMGTISEGVDSIQWNGQDGFGNDIAVQDSLTINYTGTIRYGELHIALTDVEGNPGGVTFEWMNAPAGFPTDQFYYDHSDIDPNVAQSVSSPDGMSGVAGDPKPTNIPYTYQVNEGNDDYIDQWFFIEQSIEENSITINIVLDCFCDPEDSPDLTLTGNDVCAGDELVITASNENTTNGLSNLDYTWTGPDMYEFTDPDVDPTATSEANVTNDATINNSGTYMVIATTSAMCADTASIEIFVSPTPVLEASDPNPDVCAGENIQICASNITDGIGQLDCSWTGPNGFSAQGTGNGTDQICITISGATSAQEGDYTLVCTANNCQSDSLVITLDVQPTPEISGVSPNADVCVGETVELTASNNVIGTGPVIYTWTGPGYSFSDTSQTENGPFTATIDDIQLSNAGDYILVLQTFAGCESAPQTVTIGVNPNPEICLESGGGDACVGQTVTLSALNCEDLITTDLNYEWIGPNGNALCSGTGSASDPFICEIIDIQNNNSGDYCLTLTDPSTGCMSTEVCLTVNVLPNIVITDVTSDDFYCGGTSVTLTGNTNFGSDVIYTWTGPGGSILCTVGPVPPGTPLTCVIDELTASTAGTYILTVASLDGCVSDAVSVNVGILDGVEILSVSGGGTYCPDDTISLTGTGSSTSGTVIYEWTDPNGMMVGGGSSGPTGPFDATVNDPVSGTYTLIVSSDPDNCSDTATVEIELVEQPVANIINSADTTICERDSLLLCAQNTNPNITDFTYTWTTPSGMTITGSGSGTDIFCEEIDPAMDFGAGTYTLEICSGNCCADPVSINVNLNPNPIMSTISGGGTYCEGDTAIVCFSNLNDLVTDWFYTCNIDTFQTTGTGTGTNEICLEVTTSTFIFCSLESFDGCVSDLEGTEVIFVPSFVPTLNVPNAVCSADTLSLNGTNISSCTGTVTYTWTGPNGYSFTGTAPCQGPFPAINTNPMMSGDYCLELNDSTGSNCTEIVCASVIVYDLPNIVGGTIDGGGEYCEGESVSLSATINNPSGGEILFEWTQDGTVISSGSAPSGSEIILDLGNVDSTATGNYCLNLTCVETGCSNDDLGCTQVTVNTTPIIEEVTGSGTYCQGFDVMLNGSGPDGPGTVNYTWTGPNNYEFTGSAPCGGPYPAIVDNVDSLNAGIYTLVVTKGTCESEPEQVIIEVNPTPDIINSTSSGEECAGVTVPISFTIDPDGAASVDWMISGPGLDESGTVTELTDFTFDVTVNGDATYTITAISDQGCEAVPVVITITEIQVPIPVIEGPTDIVCAGDSYQLCAGNPVQGASYTWCLDGVAFAGPSDDPCTDVEAQPGSITVKITLNGCTEESSPFSFEIAPPPVANDDSYTTDAGVPVSGNVLDNDTPNGAVTITVVSGPGNGTVSIGPNGEMEYTPGFGFSGTDQFIYEICSEECPEDCDDAIVTIVVNVPPCDVPNVITPNGDGANDVLIIDCVPAFPNNRLRIFNRWGDEIEVFEPYTTDNFWDGTIGSSKDPVPAGTYFYIFQEDRSSDDNVAGYIKVVR